MRTTSIRAWSLRLCNLVHALLSALQSAEPISNPADTRSLSFYSMHIHCVITLYAEYMFRCMNAADISVHCIACKTVRVLSIAVNRMKLTKLWTMWEDFDWLLSKVDVCIYGESHEINACLCAMFDACTTILVCGVSCD